MHWHQGHRAWLGTWLSGRGFPGLHRAQRFPYSTAADSQQQVTLSHWGPRGDPASPVPGSCLLPALVPWSCGLPHYLRGPRAEMLPQPGKGRAAGLKEASTRGSQARTGLPCGKHRPRQGQNPSCPRRATTPRSAEKQPGDSCALRGTLPSPASCSGAPGVPARRRGEPAPTCASLAGQSRAPGGKAVAGVQWSLPRPRSSQARQPEVLQRRAEEGDVQGWDGW